MCNSVMDPSSLTKTKPLVDAPVLPGLNTNLQPVDWRHRKYFKYIIYIYIYNVIFLIHSIYMKYAYIISQFVKIC